MREAIPRAFLRNVDAPPGVVIEQPDDIAASIESEVCIVPGALVTKETTAAISNIPDEVVRSDDPV